MSWATGAPWLAAPALENACAGNLLLRRRNFHPAVKVGLSSFGAHDVEELIARVERTVRNIEPDARFSEPRRCVVPRDGRTVSYSVMEVNLPRYSAEDVQRIHRAVDAELTDDEADALYVWLLPFG